MSQEKKTCPFANFCPRSDPPGFCRVRLAQPPQFVSSFLGPLSTTLTEPFDGLLQRFKFNLKKVLFTMDQLLLSWPFLSALPNRKLRMMALRAATLAVARPFES